MLKPILKYPGGKEKELPIILENAPNTFENFYDPFVGGGSVHMAFNGKNHLINDKSIELSTLYSCLKTQDRNTFADIEAINNSWKSLGLVISKFKETLISIYKEDVDNSRISKFIDDEYQTIKSIFGNIDIDDKLFLKELNRNVIGKFKRMRKLSLKTELPSEDIFPNIETAFYGSLYMFYRALYNNKSPVKSFSKVSLYVFIRNYTYSGMFRFNDKGEFNVPYGGMGYNKKTLDTKLKYWTSNELIEHLAKTTVGNYDFYEFVTKYPPTENDFMFLDPPYDSEFSTYDGNEFGKSDQKRLASYLITECKCKWMMVIKNTEFIRSLYDGHGLTIKSFDKKYQVSFMNRNNKDVTHLIIMNY